ncbi:hypothetical protein [Lentzea aerocolonigenes]|uniref:hypothetical protein n=1 Tax=Lentzea aerocolonigenes TaxID=68170 RepID=UPI000A688ED8|nr:hypothetical protein [Lentzea aerocolonigenes]MCP2243866.1 hypothetical protein [Lentzea aerocolonigenes]
MGTVNFRHRMAVALCVLLALSGCTATRPPDAPAAVLEVVAPGVEVTTRDLGAATAPTPEVHFLSNLYELSPSGPLPSSATATATVRLRNPVPEGDVVVVATRQASTAEWEYLPATIAQDRASVSFTTDHFSEFALLGFDLGKAIDAFKRDFVDGLTGNLTQTADRPTCDNDQRARGDGYSITSDSGDALLWCLGADNAGHRVLKVTNNRRYPLLASHGGLDVIDNAIDWGQLSSLSRVIAGDKAVIAPSGTVAFNADLAPGTSARITTEADAIGQSLYALQTGVTALVQILTRFGAGSGVKAVDTFNKMLQSQSCLGSLGKGSGGMIAGCLDAKQIMDTFGYKGLLLAPVMVAGPIVAFFNSQWNAIVDQFNGNSIYRIEVAREKPAMSLSTFAGQWMGHTRSLTITADGRATEHVGSGCCNPVIDLTFTLSDPQWSPAEATATVTVTSVQLHDWSRSDPAPKVGQMATIKLADGIITEPLAGATYCDHAKQLAGVCGA